MIWHSFVYGFDTIWHNLAQYNLYSFWNIFAQHLWHSLLQFKASYYSLNLDSWENKARARFCGNTIFLVFCNIDPIEQEKIDLRNFILTFRTLVPECLINVLWFFKNVPKCLRSMSKSITFKHCSTYLNILEYTL